MDNLFRPIIGIENRTPQEVFDIMCDRFNGPINQRDRLIAALTPDGDTKAAYMGEIKDDVMVTAYDEDGEYVERNLKPYVSWTAIKAVMALIRKEGGI